MGKKAKHKVLVVEDNKANVQIATLYLEKLGYEYKVAYDGNEAIKILKKDSDIDLILMDLQMDGRDGFETTKMIKTLERTGELGPVPVIAVTADDLIGDKERCLEVGMDDYIPKPLTLDVLKDKLEFHIDE